MKNQKIIPTVVAIAGLALVVGCADTRHHRGAANDRDSHVLTGGPTTGTKVDDLPIAVKQTLKGHNSSAEIADIDKKERNGRVYYRISFKEPGKNPVMFIQQDGRVLTEQETK